KAPQAAGVIHSDFERGFIRAETIAYDDYVTLGGEAGAQQAGKMRLEGKSYDVADGDGMHFRIATLIGASHLFPALAGRAQGFCGTETDRTELGEGGRQS